MEFMNYSCIHIHIAALSETAIMRWEAREEMQNCWMAGINGRSRCIGFHTFILVFSLSLLIAPERMRRGVPVKILDPPKYG
jgi:hypothetical protein